MNGYNNFGYAGGMNPVGYAAAAPESQAPIYKNPLTPEEMEIIRKGVEQFSLAISKEEFYRGICGHRDQNGVEALIDNGDGTSTCRICQKTFKVSMIGELEVEARMESLLDCLQTIKLLYLDLPTEAAREYFQIIPLIEKLPEFYKLAVTNFTKHENWNNQRFMGSPNTVNLYQMLAGGGINAMYQNQMMNQHPLNYGQPQGMPMQQQGFNPMQQPSPFFNQQPQMQPGYTPMNQNYQYQPNPQAMQQCAQPAGNVAPTTTAAITDGSNVDVTATFKS